MRLNNDDIIGLPVFTASGTAAGTVSGFEMETADHQIISYRVKNAGLVKGLFKKELIVYRHQVLSINRKKMVIEDNILAAVENKKFARLAVDSTAEAPTMSIRG